MGKPIRTIKITTEQDVVRLRQGARQISQLLGFGHQDQIRIATSVSEIGRNTLKYATEGMADFSLDLGERPCLTIRIMDKGKGIENLASIMDGTYTSGTGLGLGIVGAKRLMDQFRIESSPHGTQVFLIKQLPPGAKPWTVSSIAQLSADMIRLQPDDPYDEIRFQNQELLRTLEELTANQSQLSQLNQELEDTNRGVLALYTELDEKSKIIQKNSEAKNKFFSNISHELRSPAHSILALARMLLDHTDGDLTPEQEKQVGYILSAANTMQDMVNDLLDLAKMSAGKISVKVDSFGIEELFAALRGTMKPLLAQTESVALLFEKDPDLPLLSTDQNKLLQILRNFISNAIKFTEAGEIRVTAKREDREFIRIAVSDTGVGIDPKYHAAIFEEFEQIEGPLQAKQKGTGLGLPLSRKLAEILGGKISLTSKLGKGATFAITLPLNYLALQPSQSPAVSQGTEATPIILVIDDDEIFRYLVRDALKNTPYLFFEAASGSEGIALAQKLKPSVILLDLIMPKMSGVDVLNHLKASPETSDIPVIINTTKTLAEEESTLLLDKAMGIIPKQFSSRQDTSMLLLSVLSQAIETKARHHG